MPFDKDSFLKGVITGMRLPRTPGGKPPIPPVPSGRYILTESGEKVLTEIRPPEEDVQLYSTGVWYDTVIKRHDNEPNKRRFRWSGDKELPIFGYYFEDIRDQRATAFLSETPLAGTTLYLDYEYEVFNTSTGQWEIRSNTAVHDIVAPVYTAGIYYVHLEAFTYTSGSNFDWPAFEYKIFGRYDDLSDVLDYIAQFKPSPMITEDNENG